MNDQVKWITINLLFNKVADALQLLDAQGLTLYNCNTEKGINTEFDEYIQHSIETSEQGMLDALYVENKILNCVITL